MTSVERLRRERGMSQRELGRASGVPGQVISRWERVGTDRASFALMARVARALEVPMEDLLDGPARG